MQQPPDPRGQRHIIRLLIVDDVPETAQNIQKLLRYEPDIQVIGVAMSGHEAIIRAGQLRPDIILMDINLRDMDGLKAAEAILREVRTTIVMMSVHSEPEYFSRAMMIGARGYLIKPFSTEDLVKTLRTAYIARLNQRPTVGPGGSLPAAVSGNGRLQKVIAVYSPKGGAGRSVIAANLAIALQQSCHRQVALVDANLQSGDAHVLLNITSPTTIEDLREAGSLDAEIINGAMTPHEGSGVRLLRAPASPESAETFTAEAMKVILEQVREQFDYVVIDTDTTFSEATLVALELADQIIAVTTLEVTTINRVGQFFEVADRLGYPRSKIKLICNRVEGYYGIRPAQVEARLRTRFIAQIPEDSKLVVASVNRGVPFVIAQKNAPISAAVVTLAQRLDEMTGQPGEASGGKERAKRFGIF